MGQKDSQYRLVVKPFSFAKHYAIMHSWWNSHGSYPPKPEHLPKNGFVILESGEPICAGFLYHTDSAICVFEFMVSSPDAEAKIKRAALMRLIDFAKKWAEVNGYGLIYTSHGIHSLINLLAESGFMKADTNQQHMFFEVNRG